MNARQGWFVYAPSKGKPRKLYERYADALADAKDIANKETTDVYVLETTALVRTLKIQNVMEFGVENARL